MKDVRVAVDPHSSLWRDFKAMCAKREVSIKELVKVLCQRELERWQKEQRDNNEG